MKCPECQIELCAGSMFCKECGRKLELTCTSCGHSIPPDSKFCLKYGHKLISAQDSTVHRDSSFDEKLAKIQKYLPGGLTQKILSQRDRIESELRHVRIMFLDMKGYTPLTERLGCHNTQVRNQASYRPFQSGCRIPEATLALELRQSSTIQDRSPLTFWGVARRISREAMDRYLRAKKTLKQGGNER